MSWNDQDIDQLFKGAKAPEPAAFQESFWAEMEAMLPEQKRKKAGVWWIASGAATLVLLVGGVFLYLNQSGQTNHTLVAKSKMYANKPSVDRKSAAEQVIVETVSVNDPVSSKGRFSGTDEASCGNAMHTKNGIVRMTPSGQVLTDVITIENTSLLPSFSVNQQVEELVIVDRLPANDVEFGNPLVFTANSNELPTDCYTYKTCAAKSINFPKPARFYLQTTAGIGQSAQHVVGQSDLVHFYTIGGGLYKKLDRMVFTFGANMRVDFTKNILYTTYPSNSTRIDTKYSQLYSFEMPVSMGYESGRNSIVATVTPGFQTAFSGNQQETQNEVVVRSEQTFGKISNAKTLTMEIGATYWRSLAPNWYAGLGMNVDILKPFNSTMYAGEQRLLPLNGQLSLRRTF
ncbi:MAG: hypothetical protein QE487_17985 [Fluviicola sp.]|nr:hypothetical protein [Fluviicola sp.]